MKLLNEYKNGNTIVKIYSDGTKERYYEETPIVEFPESIDCKITNYCDSVTCVAHCHEKSNLKGKHADLDKLVEVLSILPAGKEIALGGGATTSHPNLIPFLIKLKEQGLITNITINEIHIKQNKELIIKLINEKLIYGVGISYSSSKYLNDIKDIINITDNVVFHLIMGINTVKDIDILKKFCGDKVCKILILGYKNYGMGINYYLKNNNIEDNKYDWYIKLASYFKKKNLVLSFDNIAIEQMNLKRFFTDKSWNEFYMGNDGKFTMYIDGVNQEFSKSSTLSNRKSFNNINLLDFFKELNNE